MANFFKKNNDADAIASARQLLNGIRSCNINSQAKIACDDLLRTVIDAQMSKNKPDNAVTEGLILALQDLYQDITSNVIDSEDVADVLKAAQASYIVNKMPVYAELRGDAEKINKIIKNLSKENILQAGCSDTIASHKAEAIALLRALREQIQDKATTQKNKTPILSELYLNVIRIALLSNTFTGFKQMIQSISDDISFGVLPAGTPKEISQFIENTTDRWIMISRDISNAFRDISNLQAQLNEIDESETEALTNGDQTLADAFDVQYEEVSKRLVFARNRVLTDSTTSSAYINIISLVKKLCSRFGNDKQKLEMISRLLKKFGTSPDSFEELYGALEELTASVDISTPEPTPIKHNASATNAAEKKDLSPRQKQLLERQKIKQNLGLNDTDVSEKPEPKNKI